MKCQGEVCCCSCNNQVILIDHGSNNMCGWGCTAFLSEGEVYWGDFEHGDCAGLYVQQPKEIECEQTFAPDNYACTTCKYYGVCISKEYPVSSERPL